VLKGENHMSIEIKADRIIMYKLTEINMLSQVDLPDEYLARIPHIYKNKNGKGFVLRYINSGDKAVHTVFIDVGDEITANRFKLLEYHIKRAGQRLHDINHKNDKKTNEKDNWAVEWTGSYTFEV